MRIRHVLNRLGIACLLCLVWASASAQDGTVQSYTIGRFTFESGASIDNTHVRRGAR